MKSLRSIVAITLFCGLFGAGMPSAFASPGLAVSASQIPEQARRELARQIAEEQRLHPEAFEALRNVRGHKPEVYTRLRNPVPMVDRELRRLGAPILLPMLNALSFEAPVDGHRTEAETAALTLGMLEAVGELRDARSAPVLEAVFASSAKQPKIARAAAVGLGRLCSDGAAVLLEKHAAKAGALQIAAIAGLGQCRRLSSANQLAALLSASKDAAVLEETAKSLGSVGSSWAWKAAARAASPPPAGLGEQVRAVAAKALVDGFTRVSSEAREPFRNALLMVEHPQTPVWIENAKRSADANTVSELNKLLVQVKRAAQP